MQRIYLEEKEPIHFKFEQNEDDFIVDEIGLDWKGSGNYTILHIKKVEMTTWDMIAEFAKYLNLNAEKIGYAGLKDKHATTTQYISIEARYEKELKRFKHPQIKILSSKRHSHAIRMGDLVGNRFTINLFEVNQIQAGQIEKLARKSEKLGLPNYFGYQRFGRDGDSIEQAKKMIAGDLHIEDAKLKKFLISIYQSVYFNEWLAERVKMSREQNGGKFLLLEGDLYIDSKGKLFTPKQPQQKDFEAKKVVPTGLLCGRGVYRSTGAAAEIEAKYDDGFLYDKGLRREAIIFPKDIEMKYTNDFDKMNIAFTLPKGSYATVFLENIASKEFKAKKVKKPKK
ncbi:tRNA pseudouridine(13) synthase TruD [Sulfurimonas aquatica]|uniref:tRNA pseudouridine synthase D n=1 Tax=Sulfurimonas aquatica TaxID=2672570 RepID=A0A975B0X0_9BACT|nr:tRNA pseudouridine(13) synthase TruD [Sulfurimonas aquatica]QSZ42090.1 tRNA pseudouridine(13) synthase TruD [Sulfurimonas aquatica]